MVNENVQAAIHQYIDMFIHPSEYKYNMILQIDPHRLFNLTKNYAPQIFVVRLDK